MEWEIYGQIRQRLDSGEFTDALKMIEENRDAIKEIAGSVACLEARCYECLGDRRRAIVTLEQAIASDSENYWLYSQIASSYRDEGRSADCFSAYREAHRVQGWQESKKNGYIFTHDFFSSNIPTWEKWFSELITIAPIQMLEIGSWQGGSATWSLDKVLAPRGGRLTCVDTFEGSSEHTAWIHSIGDRIESIFDHNIKSSGHSSLCRKIIGRSHDVLRQLYAERFHFIYIDGAHEARYVIEDAILSYGMLFSGGYLLFDDYDFKFANRPAQNTARAIDAFIEIYQDEIEVVSKSRQVLLRKR